MRQPAGRMLLIRQRKVMQRVIGYEPRGRAFESLRARQDSRTYATIKMAFVPYSKPVSYTLRFASIDGQCGARIGVLQQRTGLLQTLGVTPHLGP